MRLAVTVLGLDLFSLELTTDDSASDGPGDCATYPVATGFCLPERDGGTPELVD